jgi:hypothetical protein
VIELVGGSGVCFIVVGGAFVFGVILATVFLALISFSAASICWLRASLWVFIFCSRA